MAILVLCASSAPAQSDAVASAVESLQRGDASRAESILRAEAREHPNNADALGVLAVVLDQQKRFSEADAFYRRALALTPRSASLLNNYGNHLIATGKLDAAHDAFARVLAAVPGHPNATLQLAHIALKKKSPEEALRYLDRLPPAATQRSPEPLIARMQGLYELHRDAEADAILAKLDADARLSYPLGIALAAAGQYAKAEERLSRALELAPGNRDIAYNLALAASHAGHDERARDLLETVVRAEPANAAALYDLAAVRAKLGDREGALKLLAEAARIAPDRPEIYELIARMTADLGYFGDAVNAWDNYLKLVPKDEVARRERAFAASAVGHDPGQALAELRAYAARHPSDAVGHYELGIAESAESPDQALAQFDRAVQLKPDLVPARIARGLMNFKQARFDAALADFEAARKFQPDNPVVLDRLGQTYAALDRPADAVAVLRRAAELAPRDSKTQLHLGRALMSAGRQEEARAVLARFRELGPERANPHPAGLIDFLSLSSEQQLARYRAGVERTVKRNPDNAEAQVRYLELLLGEGKFDEADAVAKRILELAPPRALLQQAGDALLAAERYRAARDVLRKADPTASLALATFYAEGAEPALKLAASENGDFGLVRARILDAIGRPDEAIGDLKSAAATSAPPPNPAIGYLRVAAAVANSIAPEAALNAVESRWPDLPNTALARAILAAWAGHESESRRMLETATVLGSRDAEARFGHAAPVKDPAARALAIMRALVPAS